MIGGVTVAKLREVLAALRDDDLVVGNAVGNLMIDRDGEYAGYVDLKSDADCEVVITEEGAG